MNKRIAMFLAVVLAAAAAFAAEPQIERRKIVVRNGKVISSTDGGAMLRRVYLGVSLLDVSSEMREFLGAPKDHGVVVQSVTDGSPAEKAGIRVGDVIVAVDGKQADESWDVIDTLGEKKNGDVVRVDLVRGKARQTVTATLAEHDFAPQMRELDLSKIEHMLNAPGMPGMWRARVESSRENCSELQGKIHDLEGRLQDLEKKLQK